MRLILLIIVTLVCHFAAAQGLHSSSKSHPLTNPANFGSGSANYEGRFQLNYRSQWSGILGSNGFKTAVASYDQRFGLAKNDFLGLGVVLSSDQAGSAGFAQTSAGFGASLLKHLGGNRLRKTYLSGGVLGTFNQRSVDPNKVLFADQIEFGTSAEILPLTSRSYFDAGVGLQLWSFPQRNQDFKHAFRLGGSVFHVNKPAVGFLAPASTYRLPLRLMLEASAILKISKPSKMPLYLIGSLSWEKHGPIQKFRPHVQLRFDLPSRWENAWIQIGTGARLNNTEASVFSDAIITDFTLQIQQVQLAIYYDFTISPLAQMAQGSGSLEIALRYLIPAKTKRGVYCPNF